MRYVFLMHIVETTQNLPDDVCTIFLRESFQLQYPIVELAALHQLGDDVIAPVIFDNLKHFHETWMVLKNNCQSVNNLPLSSGCSAPEAEAASGWHATGACASR